MEWFYAYEGKQRGPISESELLDLALKGIVTGETLVWREGMSNWTPYAQAAPGAVPPAPPSSAPSDPAPAAQQAVHQFCAECGRSFPWNEMVRMGNSFMCQSCYPAYMQRIQMGMVQAGAMRYAGFWIRFLAVFIDGVLINLAFLIPSMIIALLGEAGDAGAVLGGLIMIATLLALIAYEPFFIGKYGATPGKMAAGLKVVTANGAPVSYGLAIGRALAKFLSALVLYLGFIIAGFDEEKRALHDHICGTRVIHKN